MKLAITVAAVLAVAVAKPEMYKEKEDFQYTRSSSDEGTKSGYYGAQRGNMGGNYEKAHNMDNVAQNQMSGIVKQVDGELGDASNSRTGSVFAASNSRGLYGSGNYDISNLQGRDFREGTKFTDTASYRNSNYATHNTGYHNAKSQEFNQQQSGRYYGQNADGSLATIAAENIGAEGYGSQSGQSSQYHREQGYRSESGYRGNYGQTSSNLYGTNGYGSNVKSRLINTAPVRVVVRPGGTVTVPVAAQTYETRHRNTASHYEDNYNVNSEAADLNSIDNVGVNKPLSNGKHYESSYRYHKEWEKQGTQPVAVPLAVPTINTGVNDLEYSNNYHAAHDSALSAHEIASHSGYNVKSSQAQSHRQSNYNAQQYGSNLINAEAFKLNNEQAAKVNQDALTEVIGHNKPNGYQSSYSYHKSWERQGDPYVIKPVPIVNSQASQRLYSSKQHYQNDCDCDEEQHIRMSRSVGQEQQSQNLEDFGQQTQNLEDFGQQSQNLVDLGQQSQNLEDFGQQTQNLEDFGQQSQNLQDFGQQSQNLEDLGQQTQNLENFGQQSQNLQDFGQQSQNLEDFGQQTQNLETFGQTQNLQSYGQQTQQSEDLRLQTSQHLEDLGQHAQRQQLADLGQNLQKQNNFRHNVQKQHLEDLGQHVQTQNLDNFEQQTQQGKNQWEKWESLGQQQQQASRYSRLG